MDFVALTDLATGRPVMVRVDQIWSMRPHYPVDRAGVEAKEPAGTVLGLLAGAQPIVAEQLVEVIAILDLN